MKGKELRETVGLIAVVAGLLFVGMEVRQNAEATRAATVLQIKEGWLDTNLSTATSRDLQNAFLVVETDSLGADPGSLDMVRSFHRVLLHNWSNAYWQYRNGALPEEQWLPHQREMADRASDPLTWWMWNDIQRLYDDRFRSLMDSLRTANGH